MKLSGPIHTPYLILVTTLIVLWGIQNPSLAAQTGCTTKDCHAGIMDIVPGDLPMMALIKQTGQLHGDPDGCIICHGGNPLASKKEKAHKAIPKNLSRAPGPKAFYPDPGSVWIAQNTCGVCHAGYVYRVRRSLMNTEAGKIQGNLNTWGIARVQKNQVAWGNHNIKDTDGPVPSGGFPAYETYMKKMKQAYPHQFPDQLKQLPAPSVEAIEADPKLAALTYQRQECQRCHLGIKGRQRRGDYRGMGCSACHMVYGNEGLYEGKDQTIPRDKPGHILKHRIAGNRKTQGIPVETCITCHNRGKRIGVSFTGLMESAFSGPFDSTGNPQPKLHGKTYTPVLEDLHHRTQSREGNPKGGLVCQDCHTSMDVHGDGNITTTTLGQVEIECSDCHGTPRSYPWELPLGHGDEFGRESSPKTPRGTAKNRLMSSQQFGYDYDGADGYLVSARGNPLGNVVRKNNQVMVHSATGNDFNVPVLKNLTTQWKNLSAAIAMAGVEKHMDKMECYACHGAWAPQCYGCHVTMDYSQDSSGQASGQTDWVASGNKVMDNGLTAERLNNGRGITIPGKAREQNGYMRWEDPILGINGENRVSPLMPGCQVVYTVIARDGKTLVHNQAPKNPGEAVAANQTHIPLALDMAPVQPHTASPRARRCESCHTRAKTMGLGIGDGLFKTILEKDLIVEPKNGATGERIGNQHRVQIPEVPGVAFDWSRIVTPEGVQVSTVGSHWPLSRSFNREEINRISKTGLCMGCHQFQGAPGVWKKIAEAKDTHAHNRLMEEMMKQFKPSTK